MKQPVSNRGFVGARAIALAVIMAISSAIAVPAVRGSQQTSEATACQFSPPDQAWLDDAVAAWNNIARGATGIRLPQRFEARVFDANCLLASSSAMVGGSNRWRAARHDGKIPLPDGKSITAQVTSFASSNGKTGYFVMSTPSVWHAGGVDGGPLGLRTLMIAVLIHEGSHVAQIPTYGSRMERLSKRYRLPDSFSDDSIQKRFQGNASFAASVARETDLLLAASRASEDGEARRLAGEARRMMRVRQRQWYAGADAYLTEAEDIWLTMEGSGQWAGYSWLIDPRGAGLTPAAAAADFGTRGKWWSQKEGFALFLALDRLAGPRWKQEAFRDGNQTGLQMLDAALTDARSGSE